MKMTTTFTNLKFPQVYEMFSELNQKYGYFEIEIQSITTHCVMLYGYVDSNVEIRLELKHGQIRVWDRYLGEDDSEQWTYVGVL